MTHLLDTNVCVEHLRSRERSPFLKRFRLMPADAIAVCSVVRAELLAGAYHSKSRKDELPRVIELLALFRSLPFDDPAAEQYGRIRAHIESLGTPIGSNDLMIASIALANGLTLVTHNSSEFSRVPDLKLEDWHIS